MDELTPPTPFPDLGQLEDVLAAILPDAILKLSSLWGKRVKQPTRKQAAHFKNRLRLSLKRMKPYLLALGAMRGELSETRSTYALLEGLLREHLRNGGVRVSERGDAFAVWLAQARKIAKPQSQNLLVPGYRDARAALSDFLAGVAETNLQAAGDALHGWANSSSMESHLQYVRQFRTLARRFRKHPPKRATNTLIVQLAEEYRSGATYFEQRLRLLLQMDAAANGQTLSKKQLRSLGLLLQRSSKIENLRPLTTAIDRHVRNALMHATPPLDVNTGTVTFHDFAVTVTWTYRQFFEQTRALTITAIVLGELELLWHQCSCEAITQALWAQFYE